VSQEVDLTDVEAACASGDSFSIITDKGTLDAIGLSGRPDARSVTRHLSISACLLSKKHSHVQALNTQPNSDSQSAAAITVS
jgi:hypothetical protein